MRLIIAGQTLRLLATQQGQVILCIDATYSSAYDDYLSEQTAAVWHLRVRKEKEYGTTLSDCFAVF